MTSKDRKLRGWLAAIVVVHGAVTAWHGAAHLQVPVPLTPMQTAFVSVVIMALPLVGLALLWTRHGKAGAWVIAASMLASLIFGIVNHYVLDSPDHVTRVPEHAWRHSFVLSAALVAATEAIGTVLGTIAAVSWRGSGDDGNR